MNHILVSVIMPAFNSSQHISEAIESVLSQTEKNLELLIIDGGSNDGTVETIRRYKNLDPRVKLIYNPDDRGPAHARATGILKSGGQFIAFLDADDLWLPTKLAEQVAFMELKQIDFSYTFYSSLSKDGLTVTCPHSAYASYNFWKLLALRGIGTLTVVIRRRLLSDDVLSHQTKSHGEELLWWLLILRKGYVARLYPKDLARYRKTEGSLSSFLWRHQTTVWTTYRCEIGLNPILGGILYASYLVDVTIRRIRTGILTKLRSR
jgi:teichuronic acid biosynthesis glycosyltransferase TuaG